MVVNIVLFVAALQEFSLLYEEACFFQLTPLQSQLETWRSQRGCTGPCPECLVVHVAPELGERISVSAHRAVIQEVFPEVRELLSPSLNSCWNPGSTHLSRFPLSGCCRLNSVQVGNAPQPLLCPALGRALRHVGVCFLCDCRSWSGSSGAASGSPVHVVAAWTRPSLLITSCRGRAGAADSPRRCSGSRRSWRISPEKLPEDRPPCRKTGAVF